MPVALSNGEILLRYLAVAVVLAVILWTAGIETTSAQTQAINEPLFPQCPAGSIVGRAFGPGVLQWPQPNSQKFGFTPPPGYGPYGTLVVWQGEGHYWDEGCAPGPDNDPVQAANCDQDQLDETITFALNGEDVGTFTDHAPDTDRNYRYDFPLSNITQGLNTLRLTHPKESDSANSVFYKGVLCVLPAGEPAIEIKKYTNGEDADVAPGPEIPLGAPVIWTYIVNNAGVIELTNVTVTDDKGVTVSCPKTVLAPGESMTCSATGSASVGQYANLGTVVGTPPAGPNVTDSDPSHYFGIAAAIEIKKYTNGEDADVAPGPEIPLGAPVIWTYIVSNTGLAALTNVAVTDNQGVNVSCPKTVLAPGESMTCSATGSASVGQYANLGTVVGTPPVGPPVEDSDPSHYFGVPPTLNIEKATNGEDADVPPGPVVPVGSAVTWTYVVTTNGRITNVAVTDDQRVTPNLVAKEGGDQDDVLEPGEVWRYAATGTARAGQYANLGIVTGQPVNASNQPVGASVRDEDLSHYFGLGPGIDLEKLTNGEDADAPTGPLLPVGSQVTWSFLVRNTGSEDLTGVQVTDDQLGVVTCPQTVLAPGEGMTCTVTGLVEVGQYANFGTVMGTSPKGELVHDEDPSHYFGLAGPGLDIEKYTNGESADSPPGPEVPVGDLVVWTYVVENTGERALRDVVIGDNIPGVVPEYVEGDENANGLLDVGEIWFFEVEGMAQAGQHANVGTVVAQPVDAVGLPVGGRLSDADLSHYFGIAPPLVTAIGGRVWLDSNQNGLQDLGEEGLLGIPVSLYRVGQNDPIAGTSTGADGLYRFDGLNLGSYFVDFDVPAGYVFSPPNMGTEDTIDSDALAPILGLILSDGGITAKLNQPLTYTIGLANPYPALDAEGAVLSTAVPAGTTALLTLSTADTGSTPGWTCTATPPVAGTMCTFVVGTVEAGTSDRVQFVVQVGSDDKAVPTRLNLAVNLSQAAVGRTQVISPPAGGVDVTVDAGLHSGQYRRSAQIGTVRGPDNPTALDETEQPGRPHVLRLPFVEN